MSNLIAVSTPSLDPRLQTGDPFCPPPPAAPVYDPHSNTWIFGCYDHVLAALCQPSLRQTAEKNKQATTKTQARAGAGAAMARLKLGEIQPLMVSAMESIVNGLPSGPFDLVADLIRPWSIALLASMLGADRAQAQRLASLALNVSGGPTEARTSSLRASFPSVLRHPLEIARLTLRKKSADQDLERMCAEWRMPGLKPVFLGLTQTLASFLANAWLALLHHPDASERLRTDPALMGPAIDELLRYAGLVHTLVRHTPGKIEIGGIAIAPGQTIVLKIASANRDPRHFHLPNRLILDRHPEARHLALGGGPHACVAAPFVCMAATAATSVLVSKLPAIALVAPVEWSSGAVISFPTRLPVCRKV